MSIDITQRDTTRNQTAFDYLIKKLLPGKKYTITRNYANISGAEEDVAVGQLAGIVASTGKVVVCKSGATDGSQKPIGVFVDALTDIEIGGTVDSVVICNGGQIDESLIVCNGSDTLDTVVDYKRLRDWLITNGNNVELFTSYDNSNYDN